MNTKRPFIVIVLAAFALLMLLIGIEVLGGLLFRSRREPQMAKIPDETFAALKQVRDSQGGGQAAAISRTAGGLTIESSSAFSIRNATNASVTASASVRDNQSFSSVVVEMTRELPGFLSKPDFEKIKPGMKYTDVAGALGGELTKGSLPDTFSGSFTVINGKRQVALTFQNGVIESKSSTGLDQ